MTVIHDKHTEAQVNKANKVLGLLRRSFETLEKETLGWFFKALVSPQNCHVEYCTVASLSYPVYESDATLLDGVHYRRGSSFWPRGRLYK